eukprot:m.254234 g.254234  ORF g.254234 m.254234 type:complete len:71 (-) comp16168_c0_seq11:660-872(-)
MNCTHTHTHTYTYTDIFDKQFDQCKVLILYKMVRLKIGLWQNEIKFIATKGLCFIINELNPRTGNNCCWG